jgi:hypothetical protein
MGLLIALIRLSSGISGCRSDCQAQHDAWTCEPSVSTQGKNRTSCHGIDSQNLCHNQFMSSTFFFSGRHSIS